jgi:hypothetical protein
MWHIDGGTIKGKKVFNLYDAGTGESPLGAELFDTYEQAKARAELLERIARNETRNITIIGRRWFQKTYGNTYHSVTVYVNGEQIGHVDFAYGYDRQFEQTAFVLLQEAGVFPKSDNNMDDYSAFLQDQREHRDKYVITVTDVARKKDL